MSKPYQEIEHKFLVRDLSVIDGRPGSSIAQAYLINQPNGSVRIRLTDGPAAYLTAKGPRVGAARSELEVEVDFELGEWLLWFCEPSVVVKMRYPVFWEGLLWQVDVFQGANDGLVVAEIELDSHSQTFSVPAWCGIEVTDDERYYNSYLADHPYVTWT